MLVQESELYNLVWSNKLCRQTQQTLGRLWLLREDKINNGFLRCLKVKNAFGFLGYLEHSLSFFKKTKFLDLLPGGETERIKEMRSVSTCIYVDVILNTLVQLYLNTSPFTFTVIYHIVSRNIVHTYFPCIYYSFACLFG